MLGLIPTLVLGQTWECNEADQPPSLGQVDKIRANFAAIATCLDSAYARANADLDDAYNATLAHLPPSQRAALVTAQQAWLAYREAELSLWSSFAGNHPQMQVLPTAIAFTRVRTDFLRHLKPSRFPTEPGVTVSDPLVARWVMEGRVREILQGNNELTRTLKIIEHAMREDLVTLMGTEQRYFRDSLRYTNDLWMCDDAPAKRAVAFCPTGRNVLNTVQVQTGKEPGWTASMSNPRTKIQCAIRVGNVAPVAPATPDDSEGVPVCR
ncbi:MAG TPA: lysozyme inhibitor LprI family protein [Gemmatimonadales bacterium]|nr:lysozyme inhibitor LprI family protein [Gemmatimonadales bacterium]